MNKLFLSGLFIFIITVVLTVFYLLIKKDKSTPLPGFTAFPNVKPSDIPGINPSGIHTCETSPPICSVGDDIGCQKSCGRANVKCSTVHSWENVNFNGSKLKAGNYCLPVGMDGKDKDSIGCGTYTGRAVWTEDESGFQAWSCSCLYPNIYGDPNDGSSSGCHTKKVCNLQDGTPTLVHLKDASGNVYDPSGSTAPTGSPYQKDQAGNPIWTCDCGSSTDEHGRKLISMPNDPYRCTIDHCLASIQQGQSAAKGWDEDKKMCDCGDPETTRMIKSPVDGKCRLLSCLDTQFKDGKCVCGQDTYWKECSSVYYPKPGLEKCPDFELNTVGGYCKDPCLSVNVGLGRCVANSADSYDVICDPGAKNRNGTCSACLVKGTNVDDYSDGDSKNICCSGDYYCSGGGSSGHCYCS